MSNIPDGPKWPNAASSPLQLLLKKRGELARYVERCRKSSSPEWTARWELVLRTYDAAILALQGSTPAWVAVAERKPSPHQWVACIEIWRERDFYNGGERELVSPVRVRTGKDIPDLASLRGVTHWYPLPDPPVSPTLGTLTGSEPKE